MKKDKVEDFKRLPVKYVRDGIKSKYKEKEPCFICGSLENIELHHLYSVSDLWHTWLSDNNLTVNNGEEVIALRTQFELDNQEKLSNDNLYSLCKPHHQRLHQIFGKSYSTYIGEKKVKPWLFLQKDKFNGD